MKHAPLQTISCAYSVTSASWGLHFTINSSAQQRCGRRAWHLLQDISICFQGSSARLSCLLCLCCCFQIRLHVQQQALSPPLAEGYLSL